MSFGSPRVGRVPQAGAWRLPSIDVVCGGLAVAILGAGTIHDLATGPWTKPDFVFSPIMLLGAGGMAVSIARRGDDGSAGRPSSAAVLLIAAALLVAFQGRQMGNLFVSGIALIALIVGLIAFLAGWRRVATYGLPLAATCLALPFPGVVTTTATFALRLRTSEAVCALLRFVGIPASNEGVIIDVGDYRLLVADACSGLQSIYSLAFMAILVLFLGRRDRRILALPVILVVVPIVLVCNTARIFVIAVVAYEGGIGRTEGAFHVAMAVLMYGAAFGLLLAVDAIAARWWAPRS